MARRLPLLLVHSMLCSLLIVPSTLAQSATEPHIPGAITSPPKWLDNVPFDIEEFFRLPPPSENAAPLYLDALYEIDSTVENCFPPSQRSRSPKAKRLAERIFKAYGDWAKDMTSAKLDREEIDSILKAASIGLAKLERAQARPHCKFSPGITLESLLPHSQSSRAAACLWTFRALRSLDRGDIDAAIDDVRRILRLGRDLKPRGCFMDQLVSALYERMACDDLVPIIVAHPRLRPVQCQRLLTILNDHERLRLDSLTIGAKADYLMTRSLIHVFEDQKLTTVDANGNAIEKKADRTELVRYMATLIAQRRQDPAINADVVLADASFTKEFNDYLDSVKKFVAVDHKVADEWLTAMLKLESAPYARKSKVYQEFFDRFRTATGDPNTTPYIFRLVFEPPTFIAQFTAIPVYTHMAQSLVALKRWELLNKKPPTSLETACRDAGLPAVPLDNFADKPIQLIQLSGRPAIYSHGLDGDDDHGQKDSSFGRKPDGDFIFILPKTRLR